MLPCLLACLCFWTLLSFSWKETPLGLYVFPSFKLSCVLWGKTHHYIQCGPNSRVFSSVFFFFFKYVHTIFMSFTSVTIGQAILLKPQLFCKSARTSPALGWSYVGNFALNSPFNGKNHGRKAKKHKSCKLLFQDQPELALNEDTVRCWRLCSPYSAFNK